MKMSLARLDVGEQVDEGPYQLVDDHTFRFPPDGTCGPEVTLVHRSPGHATERAQAKSSRQETLRPSARVPTASIRGS